jgi:tRNA threonylcarbamoyladenosine biosynthesis protein TsaE
LLQAGDVVGLIGNLGAGKTHLVQAIAGALGVQNDEVTSPTFVLIQEYAGRVPVCHLDAYRLADTDEFLELGADELLGGDCVALIEWADRVADVLPRDRLMIEIEPLSENARELRITAGGPRSEQLVAGLASAVCLKSCPSPAKLPGSLSGTSNETPHDRQP